jgi:hypothetical protein
MIPLSKYHLQERAAEPQVPIRLRSGQTLHCAPPDFLSRAVALISIAKQEIRVRSGRDDKGEGGASRKVVAEQELVFISLCGQRPMIPPVLLLAEAVDSPPT